MKALFSLFIATTSVMSFAQTTADLSQATYSGYDRNLSFSVDLGYRGSYLISGTNVKLKPNAAVSHVPGVYNGPYPWTSYKIVEFKVFVQDPVCGGSPNLQGYQRLVSFASTRFNDDQEVLLRLQVTFELESEPQGYVDYKDVEVSVPVKVYNKGSAYVLHDFENDADENYHTLAVVENALRTLNHSVLSARGDHGWTRQGLLESLANSTVFYVNTHGNPDGFQSQDVKWVHPSEVKEAREKARGNGLPPLNFAFLDSCRSGTTRDGGESHVFSREFLLPIPDGLPNGYEGLNRAMMGWLIFAKAVWGKQFNQEFWGQLHQGRTVSQARDAAVRAVLGPNAVGREYVAVYGDYYTRLMTVYTGNNSDPIGWFKVDGLESTEPGTFGN